MLRKLNVGCLRITELWVVLIMYSVPPDFLCKYDTFHIHTDFDHGMKIIYMLKL